jgi:SAM-dependent methyltransferase
MYTLKKNSLGFYQVDPMPDEEELQAYYSEKYYQAPVVKTYALNYTEEERKLSQIAPEVADFIFNNESPLKERSLYDIGCGEGFFMDGLHKLGWEVAGTDYSEEGIKNQNPHLYPKVTYKPALDDIQERLSADQKFSLVNLGNILEHVIDPVGFLGEIKNLIHKDGLVRIVVPNDNSEFQELLTNLNFANREWFHPPDHLSYFNFESLKVVLDHTGFNTIRTLGDFPIEMFLLNESSNYYKHKSTGPNAHYSRVIISNYIRERGITAYVKWAETLADIRLSRSCIFYCKVR